VQYARWSKSIVLNALGRHDEALTLATLASDDSPELFVSSWATSEQVEAAVRSGDPRAASAALERLQDKVGNTKQPWGRGIEARARALVQTGAAAEPPYVDALGYFAKTRLRPDLARTHLLYGEWLRRQSRRSDARRELRTAYDLFTTIGMEAFADRARRELHATGETIRKRATVAATAGELTPQERQIALLVRDGLSNPEVATRLFLSPRTVEWHLRKVFDKLSITSRRQLRDVLSLTDYESAG
jgi:DNA-binding CsgD family transcriptional regulator